MWFYKDNTILYNNKNKEWSISLYFYFLFYFNFFFKVNTKTFLLTCDIPIILPSKGNQSEENDECQHYVDRDSQYVRIFMILISIKYK